jgi:hypothetical protein
LSVPVLSWMFNVERSNKLHPSSVKAAPERSS